MFDVFIHIINSLRLIGQSNTICILTSSYNSALWRRSEDSSRDLENKTEMNTRRFPDQSQQSTFSLENLPFKKTDESYALGQYLLETDHYKEFLIHGIQQRCEACQVAVDQLMGGCKCPKTGSSIQEPDRNEIGRESVSLGQKDPITSGV